LLAVLELVLGGFFTIIKPLSGTAPNVTSVFLFVWHYCMCISDHCNYAKSNNSGATNIGEVPLPKHQTSRGFSPLFERIYDGELILTVFSNIGEVYNTVVSIKFMM
jgi:hypothetical protein